MKICHITTVHKVNDNRILHKECKSLHNNGHEIYLICSGAISCITNGIKIIGIPKFKNRLLQFSLISIKEVFLRGLRINADVYHFHDPELIFSGVLFRLLGKKVIYDIHENYPSSVLSKPYLKNKFIKKFLSFSVYLIEKISAPLFSKIITARPDISHRFKKYSPVTIKNFPILTNLDIDKSINTKKKKKNVIYVGGLSEIRGIKILIESFEKIKEAELWLLGPWENQKFRFECQKLRGWENTKYLGVVEPDEIYKYLCISDIGIITFLPYPNHLNTLATKPFEYMQAGLPLIMSNFPYWKTFFGDLSLYVDPYDSSDIISKINYLIYNPNIMKIMGEEGRKKVLEEYNWENESKKLIKTYIEL